MGTIKSTWAGTPITLEDQLEDAVWSGALEKQMEFDGGFMIAKNDAKYLYVVLDVVKDTHNDPGTGDYFWFTFDRNRNKAITPRYDVNYGNYRGNPNKMGRQYYLGAGRWTGLLNEEQQSECKSTFGTSPNSATPHRIWKFRFRLTDLKVNLLWWWFSSYTKFGFRVHSNKPNLNYDTPANFFRDFSKLHTLYFSRKPSISSRDLGPIMGSVGLIPTTKIDSATGRATTASNYFIHAKNAAFGGRLNVIGNRTKMDQLPGLGAKKYKVFHRSGTSGSFSEFVTSWYNYKWNGSDYVLEAASPDGDNFYKMPSAGVDYSIDDLLFQFNSTKLNTGLHQFKVKFYNNAGTEVGAATPEQILTMYIDNNVPEVSINSVKYKNAEIGACGIVNLQNPNDTLDIDFEAFDTEGNLLDYSLRARWGDGDSESIEYEAYNLTTPPANWQGSHNIMGSFNPKVTCAHSFNVYARARTTNGYGYIGKNSTYRYVTIIK
ncbi:hypothetical protein [Kordia sp.]|uniref:hypothetical protein n=1 Tax=Kordia sp. TaxID=1965332 RepID=UPI003B58F77B